MSFLHGYLTAKQLRIWSLLLKRIKQVDIAKMLGITKQTVNKSISVIEKKISRSLYEAAKLNKIAIKQIRPLKGVLLGYSSEFKADVVIFLSAKHGLQIWYKIKHSCESCNLYNECKRILLDEFEARGIELSDDERKLEPNKLAELLFNHLVGGI